MEKSHAPLMDLLFGSIIGFVLSTFISLYYFKTIKSLVLRLTSNRSTSFLAYLLPTRKHNSSLEQPHHENRCLVGSLDCSTAWMFNLREAEYDPSTFSFSKAQLCLIEIRQSSLLIFRPIEEPNHKLSDNELHQTVNLDHVEIYDLNQAMIGLLPSEMVRSKYWSKKCPIVLRHVRYLGRTSVLVPAEDQKEIVGTTSLLLFSRTRRSKEDWFYRFINASQLDGWRAELRYRSMEDSMMTDPEQVELFHMQCLGTVVASIDRLPPRSLSRGKTMRRPTRMVRD